MDYEAVGVAVGEEHLGVGWWISADAFHQSWKMIVSNLQFTNSCVVEGSRSADGDL